MDASAKNGGVSLRVAFDVGGTFTDVVISSSNGQVLKYKILTLPESIGAGVAGCVVHALEQVRGHSVSGIVHGTTVCSNAVLEGKGAVTGLITTKGFRDELEIRRLGRPGVYDVEWTRTPPLIPRRRRLEVTERLLVTGEVDQPLDEEELATAIGRLQQMEVESIAVCFMHSFTNPEHERRAAAIVRHRLPGVKVCASHEVLPEAREYERASTTALNAYLMPVVDRYLDRLEGELRRFHDKPLVMQSNGGLMSGDHARLRPIHMIESGPAAGALAAAKLSQVMGLSQVVAFDMGGTTAKACLVEDGEAAESADYEVGAGINAGGLTKGAGYALSVSAFDIAEVGAGGGSIAWLDQGGALRVGPQSAGAVPGPAGYGRGGTQATITDANLVLGYMNGTAIAGGSVALDLAAAQGVMGKLADATGIPVLQVAHGIHEIANATMARAIRAVTSERGRDPRDCVMVAFGGSGGIHAVNLAASIGIRTVYVPLMPGLFCALGLLLANMRQDVVRSHPSKLSDVHPGEIYRLFDEMQRNLLAEIVTTETPETDWKLQRLVDLRYEGQSSEMTLLLPSDVDASNFAAMMAERFHVEHERNYGYRREHEPVCIANLRLKAIAATANLDIRTLAADFGATREQRAALPRSTRPAFFGPGLGMQDAQIMNRDMLRGSVDGPVVFDEFDTTVVVPPGWRAVLDGFGNIVLTMTSAAQ